MILSVRRSPRTRPGPTVRSFSIAARIAPTQAEKLRARLALAEGTLDKAQALLAKLGGEQARWRDQAGELRRELRALPRQLLLAAGFLTYLSRCPEDARAESVAEWCALVGVSAFDFRRLLATESTLLAWKQAGLPADPLSQENAVVVDRTPRARVPFVIDPADAARSWLLAHYGGDARRPLEVVQSADPRSTAVSGTRSTVSRRFARPSKPSSSVGSSPIRPFLGPLIFSARGLDIWIQTSLAMIRTTSVEVARGVFRFTTAVELAVRFGKTLLVLDVDGLEPLLYPLARGDLQLAGGARCVVRVGEKVLDYNENFRLALVTRNPTPSLPPDAAALCTLINFTVTRSGLEGQLLGATIVHEQPELERKKTAMLKQEEDYKIKLDALEVALLEALATAEGDLLENTNLIESLSQTKEASREISAALAASAEASIELDAKRDAYRSFAGDGSRLYFLVRDLVVVNHMYLRRSQNLSLKPPISLRLASFGLIL